MQISSVNSVGGYDPRCDDDVTYREWMSRIQARFESITANASSLYISSAQGLWKAYLSGFADDATRQYHNCWTCQAFVDRFGGLVVVDDSGVAHSALWRVDDAPDLYKPAVQAMLDVLAKAPKVDRPFFSDEAVLGSAEAGGWAHFSLVLPPKFVNNSALLAAHQVVAAKTQGRASVRRAIGQYKPEVVKRALTILESDALYRGEAVIGPAQFLAAVHEAMQLPADYARHNLVWKLVTEAAEGMLHPTSTMISTLLDDLMDTSLGLDDVKRRFAAKMNPLVHRRPQAAPSAGNIVRAEKIVEKLGVQRSLERRFARLHEIEALWRPPLPSGGEAGGGVFSHLKAKDAKPAMPPVHASTEATPITYVKFRDTVLPKAESIEAMVTHGNQPFAAFVTALYDDAPPIIKWDRADRRNPFTWYMWGTRQVSGSPPSQWGLRSGWVKVTAVSRSPAEWGLPAGNDSVAAYRSAMFVLEGAVDSRDDGNALFPEFLAPEFHEISSTVEAYSKSAKIHGRDSASASGILVSASGKPHPLRVRVTAGGVTQVYNIDRWD